MAITTYAAPSCDENTSNVNPENFVIENLSKNKNIDQYRLASGRDPFSPPHTKTECDCVCDSIVGKYCCRYVTRCRWVNFEFILVVQKRDADDISGDIGNCLRRAILIAAVQGLVDAYISGDPAAFERAKATFVALATDCLADAGTSIADARIENRTWRDENWTSC